MSKKLEEVLRILDERHKSLPVDGDNFDPDSFFPSMAITNYLSNKTDSDKIQSARNIIEHCTSLQICLHQYLFEELDRQKKSMLAAIKEQEEQLVNSTLPQMTFTAPEVIKISGKCKNTIYSHLKSGKLKGHNDGDGVWTIKREDLERYLHRNDF